MKALILSTVTASVLLMGCIDDHALRPADEPAPEIFLINTFPGGDAASKFFTGRDSFGVALKATVQVTPSGSGWGNATHMGRITATQDHTTDLREMELRDGSFAFTGKTGAVLEGRYEADLVPTADADTYAFEGTLWVEGGSVRALKRPAEGQGTITGVLHPDGSMTYRLDGWLLHHVR